MLRLSYQPVEGGQRSAVFEGLVVRFGADAQCDLCLQGAAEAGVQLRHGEFISLGGTYALVGHNERCRLWVNGRQVQRVNLKGGEQIRVGSPSGPEIRVLSVGLAEAVPDLAASVATPPASAPHPVASVAQPSAPPAPPAPAPEVQRWLSQAEDKIRSARSAHAGQSSGQTMHILEEALSGLRKTEEGRVQKSRLNLVLIGATSLAAVVTLGAVIWSQQQRISQLVREKAAIDVQIQTLSQAMDQETDTRRLAEMEGHLETLMGSAREKVAQVSRSSPERGTELTEPADELERDIRRLLRSFNAETYVLPPVFKSMLALRIAELAQSPSLRADYARRQRYWKLIQSGLEKSQLPVELGYVAFTESRFDPQARNAKSGAAGMWQLMPATARSCGITVGPDRDDRLDPSRSSLAAGCYLSKLLVEFGQESFMLVLASYNRGENGVRNALHVVAREPGGYKKRDFWQLYRMKLLPQETRDYVPRVLAAALVFENPTKYGLTPKE